jgi:acyl-CoA thioesterase YciA
VKLPDSSPTLRVVPRPNDANPNGDIFGGWVMSQADIAGAIEATKKANGSVVTRAVLEFQFLRPIFVGDLISFYTEILDIGTTSITIKIKAYAQSHLGANVDSTQVAEATLVYVAVLKPGVKRAITTDPVAI